MTVHNHEWTAETVTLAASMWADGKTTAEIATKFGVSRGSVSGIIDRNRDKFERRSVFETYWTEELLQQAAVMWCKGMSVRAIAAALSVQQSSFQNIATKNRDRFPRREPHQRGKNKPDELLMDFVEPQGERYDLRRYRIADAEPVAFWKLTGQQCHFPLEALDVVAGPETPCCGKPPRDGKEYCNTHSRLMRLPH
jgi:GcrA cell cycle regulator